MKPNRLMLAGESSGSRENGPASSEESHAVGMITVPCGA
jgi:hypothetical protein